MVEQNEWIEIEVRVVTQTDGAWLIEDGATKVWIPKAAVYMERKVDPAHPLSKLATMRIRENLACEKRLI